ncbi:MAG: hypothetical protein U5K29_10245 [Acidimicrobiales bacterium]|nr:hypothetical protein [Acidimicrobiales bacterium]
MTREPLTAHDEVNPRSVRALHDLIEAEGPPPGPGDPLPPLWHWLAFLPESRQSGLQEDGHVPMPAAPTDGTYRRMFAGGRVEFRSPLAVGSPLTRTTTYSDPVEKEGRSGRLIFVTVRHEISSEGQLGVVEEQDLVYRPASTSSSPSRPQADASGTDDREPIASADLERTVVPDSRMLFRFSALTYNAHRIHYDLAYATGVEGYPGLVVHGPLQAVLLLDLLGSERDHLAGFRFRGQAPAFAGAPLRLRGDRNEAESVELVAVDPRGTTTMSATAAVER